MTDEQRDQLEVLWDAVGLADLLRGMADIAYLKEEHLAGNWQDHETAKSWKVTGVKLEDAANQDWVGNCPLN